MSNPTLVSYFDHGRQTRYNDPVMTRTVLGPNGQSSFEYFPSVSRYNGQKPGKNRLEIYLDMDGYSSDDIRVKTVDGFVVVNGQQIEKTDEYGWMKREFCRRCPLPEGHKTRALLTQYTSDGTLIITADLVKCKEDKCETPVKKREDGETPAEKDEVAKETQDPKSEDIGNESENKPVESKSAKEILVKVEVDKEKLKQSIFTEEEQTRAFLGEAIFT